MSETPIKNISAVKPSRGSGQTRQKKNFRGQNVMWRRITKSFDEDLKKFGANPAMVAPISRWVLFNHLTPTQGMAARRYADIVRKFRQFFSEGGQPSARSANLEPTRKPEEDIIQRHLVNGTIEDFEDEAKRAKRQYRRLMKVIGRYTDPISGRNPAKDNLDTLCIADEEPPAEVRGAIAVVLTDIAVEFGLNKKQVKVQGYSAAPTQHKKGVRK